MPAPSASRRRSTSRCRRASSRCRRWTSATASRPLPLPPLPRRPEPPMRVLVVGAGAVGGYFGALLARGGHDVAFVARGANLAALRAQGLRVELGRETIRMERPAALENP